MISDKSYVNSILHYTISLVEGGKKPKMNQLTFSSSIVCSYQHYYYHQEGLLLINFIIIISIIDALHTLDVPWNTLPWFGTGFLHAR